MTALSGSASPQSARRRARGFLAAGIALVVVAAALRFHGLSEQSLDHDEAVAALNSQGSWSEVLENTRRFNSTPILYPLALRFAQQAATSNFSVRFLPAAAGVLTVAVLLWWLPTVGLSRRAAFLSALLAAVSVPAITAAQGAREYSVDALLAALLIVGLLRYRRDGRVSLLTAGLFVGPLLQYGLILFGAAALGAAILAPGDGGGAERRTREGGPGKWFRERRGLAAPFLAFAAATVLSYLLTVRHQIAPGGPATGVVMLHIPWNYYSGVWSDFGAILEFVGLRTWESFSGHLTTVVGAGVAALFLGFGLRGSASAERRDSADTVVRLFALSLGIAAAAAVLRLYPLGAIRQCVYLGPVVFVMAGVVLASAPDRLSGRLRRPAAGPFLFGAAVAGIAFVGAGAIGRAHPYRTPGTAEAVFEVLAESAGPDDLVFVSRAVIPALRFHDPQSAGRYHLGNASCWRSKADCVRALREIADTGEVRGRIWMALPFRYEKALAVRVREEWDERLEVEPVVFGEGDTDLFLIPNAAEVIGSVAAPYRSAYDAIAAGEWGGAVLRSTFDLYVREGTIAYVKEPCSREEIEARFLLHFFAADPEDLPAERRRYGFENRDFEFGRYGRVLDGKCVALVPLPDYDLTRVRTGQWTSGNDSLWRGALRLDRDRFRGRVESAYRSLASGARGEPSARSEFDLWRDGTELLYLREPCSEERVEPRFFLHVYRPVETVSSAEPGPDDFENRDFDFAEHGLVEDGRCLALVPLPAEVGRIRTGQWAGEDSWSVEIPAPPPGGAGGE